MQDGNSVTVESYTYDYNGIRTSKTVNETDVTYYVVDTSGDLHYNTIHVIITRSVVKINGGYRFRKVKNLSARHLVMMNKVNEVKSLSKDSADALSHN